VAQSPAELNRIVVAIDPAVTSGEESDETGIIVAGKDSGSSAHGYVLADRSGRYPPHEWASIAIALYREFGADRIVAEVNNGGDMVEATIRMVDPNVPFTAVRASRGKVVRAEPAAALYEQGRIHHVGMFAALEDQMCEFTNDLDRAKPKRDPNKPEVIRRWNSPDRVDALVWALSDLVIEPMPNEGIYEVYRQQAAEAAKAKEASG
jgi:phage terminase large subunit-like protein